MDALKNLLTNEHSFVMLLLIVGATVLTALGQMTVDDWTNFSKWIFGIFMGGHAIMSFGDSLGGSKSAATKPTTPPAPADPAK